MLRNSYKIRIKLFKDSFDRWEMNPFLKVIKIHKKFIFYAHM